MSILPTGFAEFIVAFAPVFSKRVFQSVPGLLIGAILATGKRTVTAVLRVMGWDQQTHFQTYHRVWNRAVWSGLAAGRVLLLLLVRAFAPAASTAIRRALLEATSSRPAACAGCA